MAVNIVVGLEVIDVDQSHAVAMPVTGHARLEQLEILLQGAAVAEPRQRVVAGDCAELLVQPFQLGSL